jgi:glycerol-3-phosphate dehydrogenase
VVNAAGVWCDEVRRLENNVDVDTIRPAKGIHVTVPWNKVRNEIAVVIPVPKDRRSLFVIPWGPLPDGGFSHTYIGTTDTDYRGPLDDPQCTKDDIDYVVRALNASLTSNITAADITGVWAGLRPLVKQVNAPEGSGQSGKAARTADLSRRHLVDSKGDGIISVTGGKLTTYREMAEDTIDEVVNVLRRSSLPFQSTRCKTRRLRLHGAPRLRFRQRFSKRSLRHGHLYLRYGTNTALIENLIAKNPDLGTPIVAGLPYLKAEIVYAVHYEMALTIDDVLSRRTRALLFDRRAAAQAAEVTATLMAPLLGWDSLRIDQEIADFKEICAHEETAATIAEEELHPS